MTLSENDKRFLLSVERADRDGSCHVVYGSRQWTAARRLMDAGMVRMLDETVECAWDECSDRGWSHVHSAVEITDLGRAAAGGAS